MQWFIGYEACTRKFTLWISPYESGSFGDSLVDLSVGSLADPLNDSIWIQPQDTHWCPLSNSVDEQDFAVTISYNLISF